MEPPARRRCLYSTQVLLSGSLAVQSAIGVSTGHVDIFCTWDAAPTVRRRLIEHCGMIYCGMDDDYTSEENLQASGVDAGAFSATHHVESYAAQPAVGFHGRYGRNPLEYTSDEYYDQAAEWGAEALTPFYGKLSIIGMSGGSAGGTFPYDFALRNHNIVQLIVGKQGKKDARELLESFDLEICKCSFDGRSFHFPDPAETFARRTACTWRAAPSSTFFSAPRGPCNPCSPYTA
jgi:hypothetical protein